MKCPQCCNLESAVVDSREADDGATVRRRRECEKCQCRFTTYERVEQPKLMVVKKNGSREMYDRSKMAGGVYKAFHKRPVPIAEIEKLIERIERDLFETGHEEVPSREIGEMVMSRIGELDDVAYIRFAAVYREFTDLKTFDSEIKKLIKEKVKESD